MAHIHAAHMARFAEDAARFDTPWIYWEYLEPQPPMPNGQTVAPSVRWETCFDMPVWRAAYQYRRVLPTVTIGNVKVPAPERVAPPVGESYFAPDILDGGDGKFEGLAWAGDAADKHMLKSGLVHLTAEAAIAHAEALIALTAV